MGSRKACVDLANATGEEIRQCGKAGITVALPKPLTSGNRLKGMFVKEDLRYVADDDVYVRPAGERLTHHFTNVEKGRTLSRHPRRLTFVDDHTGYFHSTPDSVAKLLGKHLSRNF